MRSLVFCITCLICANVLPAQKKPDEARQSWLDTEVQYLITEEERAVYAKLTTPEERERFTEDFWKRRDPNPATSANEFREEFFVRVAYANQHFTAGAPGWKTERGRIYVLYGPPDRLDSRPTGGRYQKPSWQGGDTITAFPFEIWEYNYIPGIGNDITLEFVDRTSTGNYVLEMDPNRKDVFFWRRGEMPLQRGFTRAKEMPFERLEVWAKLQAPPPLRFPKLKEDVTARVSYAQLPFQAATAHIKVSDNSYLALLTLALKNSDLLFSGANEQYKAEVQLYAQVSDMNRSVVYEFDDTLGAQSSGQPLNETLRRQTLYQRLIPLKPGRYKLQLVLRDTQSEKLTTREIALAIPQGSSASLEASSLVLADVIQAAPAGQTKLDPFFMGNLRVVPNVRGYFSKKDTLGLYVEFYNLQMDSTAQQPSFEVESYLCRGPEKLTALGRENQSIQAAASTAIFNKGVALAGLAPGKHQVCVELKDHLAHQSVIARADFEIR